MSKFDVDRETDELELIELIDLGGAIDKLHKYANEVLSRDKSTVIRCRYPEYIGFLCDHVGARENIRMSRVYSSLVKLGYGIKYGEHKNGKTSISMVVDHVHDMRASIDINNRLVANAIDDIITFDGKNKQFRFGYDFVGKLSEYTEKADIKTPDLYYYYMLVGLKEIGDVPGYEHFKYDIGFLKAMFSLGKAESNFKMVASFIEGFL